MKHVPKIPPYIKGALEKLKEEMSANKSSANIYKEDQEKFKTDA